MRKLKFRGKKGYLSQVTPIHRKLGKDVEGRQKSRPPRPAYFLRLPLVSEQMVSKFQAHLFHFLFPNYGYSCHYFSFVRCLLGFAIFIFLLCPWHNDQATLNLVSGSYLFFWALIPGINSKEQHSHKISMAWFLSGLSDTRVHHSFPNYHLSTPMVQHMDTAFVYLLSTYLQYQFYTIESGTANGKC